MFAFRRWLLVPSAALVLTATWGCSGTPSTSSTTSEGDVTGTVSIRGKPMKGGTITFNPATASRNVPTRSAPIGDDGAYKITTLQGENTVNVTGPAITKEPQLGYAPKRIDVTSGDNKLDIELPPK